MTRPCTAVAVVLALVAPALPARADDLKGRIDRLVAPVVKDRKDYAVVVGVIRPQGRQVLGYGSVTLAGKRTVPDGKTIFEIGSVTKVFTGLLLADLNREGVVTLTDPARQHLPPDLKLPPAKGREITLLDLATHTSGLPVEPDDFWIATFVMPGFSENPYSRYERKHVARMLGALKLDREPGVTYEYSNLGVGLLGYALAHAAKAADYETLVAQRITGPLKMPDTRVRLSPEQQARLAPGHDADGDPVSTWDFRSLEACGGLRSTADDLLAFADAHLHPPPTRLGRATADAQVPVHDAPNKAVRIGLCWHLLRQAGGGDLPLHTGETGGYFCFLGLAPARGVGVVVLTNSDRSVELLGLGILQSLLGPAADAPAGR
jgi:CubicO group peptidase (beta-lactamase class C family)